MSIESDCHISDALQQIYVMFHVFRARQGGIKCANRRRGSSIAKDLIDSEDPKHTLFCREIAFAAIYLLFPSFDSNSNRFATADES